jgi:NADH-quinone oxidoreductase subunit M
MGTYGFLRFAIPFFPAFALSERTGVVMATLAVIGIVYASLVAMVQPDLKRLVAYSSVSHLGFVILGIWGSTVESVQGAIMVMVSHGLSTGALFFIIGMLYERRHTRAIADYGGLARVAPLMAGAFVITAFSSIGLPGLNGFIGEFTILMGALGSSVLGFGFALFSTLGVILAAIYILYMFQKVYMGELDKEENKNLPPLAWNEIAVMIPILIAIFLIGLQPAPFFDTMNATVGELVASIGQYVPSVVQALP